MKKIFVIFALAFVLITPCVLYLLRQGISLRPEGLITPSLISENLQNVAPALIARLFPNFQEADYVVFGWLPMDQDSQKVFESLQQEYQKNFSHPPNVLDFVKNPNDELLSACAKPCWVLVSTADGHQLKPDNFIEQKIQPLKKTFFSLTWVPFIADKNTNTPVPEACLSEKRLDFHCLQLLSIQKAQRKLKMADRRYFFVNAYNETDHFLFVQQEKAGPAQ